MNEKRSRRRLIAAVVLVAVALGVALSGIFTWSPVNCRHEDIDIRSGRVRTTRFILFIRVSERVTSTPVSDALQLGDYDPADPEWHRVNTFSPGTGYSPHYVFHGAIAQTQMLRMIWSISDFTPAARHETARQLLASWQHGGNYFEANHYLDALSELATSRRKQQPSTPIDVRDLPTNPTGSA